MQYTLAELEEFWAGDAPAEHYFSIPDKSPLIRWEIPEDADWMCGGLAGPGGYVITTVFSEWIKEAIKNPIDYGTTSGGDFWIGFIDPADAMMFKMTWHDTLD